MVFCVVEVEWAKFTRFFFPSDIGPFFKKVPHLTDLNRHLVHVDTRFNCENAVISKSDVDRETVQTDCDYCNPLAHAR